MNKTIKELKKGEVYYLLKFNDREVKKKEDEDKVLKCTIINDSWQTFTRWTANIEIEFENKKVTAAFCNFVDCPGLRCDEPITWPQMLLSKEKSLDCAKFIVSDSPENCIKDYNDFLSKFKVTG